MRVLRDENLKNRGFSIGSRVICRLPRSYDFLPRCTPARAANIATKTATLSAANQDIDRAIKPCSTAPGKRSGIVQAHRGIKSALFILLG